MFRHKHFIHRCYADEKTLLRKERHKQINKEWSNYAVWLKM